MISEAIFHFLIEIIIGFREYINNTQDAGQVTVTLANLRIVVCPDRQSRQHMNVCMNGCFNWDIVFVHMYF